MRLLKGFELLPSRDPGKAEQDWEHIESSIDFEIHFSYKHLHSLFELESSHKFYIPHVRSEDQDFELAVVSYGIENPLEILSLASTSEALSWWQNSGIYESMNPARIFPIGSALNNVILGIDVEGAVYSVPWEGAHQKIEDSVFIFIAKLRQVLIYDGEFMGVSLEELITSWHDDFWRIPGSI